LNICPFTTVIALVLLMLMEFALSSSLAEVRIQSDAGKHSIELRRRLRACATAYLSRHETIAPVWNSWCSAMMLLSKES
jgi:hypothetical protein